MKNPWTRKNPIMSMWLSGANAIAGSVRSRPLAASASRSAPASNPDLTEGDPGDPDDQYSHVP